MPQGIGRFLRVSRRASSASAVRPSVRPRTANPSVHSNVRVAALRAGAVRARYSDRAPPLPPPPCIRLGAHVIAARSPCRRRASSGNPVPEAWASPGAAQVRARVRPPLSGARARTVDRAVVCADNRRVTFPIVDAAISTPLSVVPPITPASFVSACSNCAHEALPGLPSRAAASGSALARHRPTLAPVQVRSGPSPGAVEVR